MKKGKREEVGMEGRGGEAQGSRVPQLFNPTLRTVYHCERNGKWLPIL